MGNEPPQNPNPNNTLADYGQNQDYLRRVDHDADMAGLRNRLDALEARVGDNTAMVTTLTDVFEKDRNIDEPLIKIMKERVLVSEGVKDTVKGVVDKIDRNWVMSYLKRIGLATWTLIVALISGGVVAFWIATH